MLVIPAIDFSNGHLARLDSGRVVPVEAFGGDPVSAARSFVEDGASWLHVVDMDLALQGRSDGLDVCSRICDLGASVQASGGIRTPEGVNSVLSTGVDRVVVGSAALAEPQMLEGLVRLLGERLAIGLEIADGGLAPRGGSGEGTLPDLGQAMDLLEEIGVARVVFTAVARVGTLDGPDLDTLGSLLRSGLKVVVAGGVGTAEEVAALAARERGPEAVVIGRALYEGALTLADAIAAAGPPPSAPN